MSRRRPVDGPTISLFPFLAVLLCTMGALLVLLVLFSRSAREEATTEGGADVAELELARDSLKWRLEQLAGVRERTAADLAAARLQLAGVEEHARSLTDEMDKLEQVLAQLEADGPRPAAADIAALEARLAHARESLDKARAEQKTKPPAYAVVPYVGRNGTHRRPLYIECSLDGVFLQPEGVRLSPGDFEGPPGPGNPLACALRAAREHIASVHGPAADPAAQPYPLLIVRPSGVMAYYAAREAIQSWGSDFGYQLIEEDWTLTFPPRDPALADVEKRAIEEARQRLAWLAEVRPVKQPRPTQQYRAATSRGGVVAEGGPSVLGDQSRFEWKNQQAVRGSGDGSSLGAGGGSGSGFGAGDGSGGSGAGGSGHGIGPGRPFAAGGSAAAGGGSGEGDAVLGQAGGSNTAGVAGILGPGGGSAGGGTAQPGGGPGGGADGSHVAAAAPLNGRPGQAAGAGGPQDAAGGAAGTGAGGSAGSARYAGGSRFGGSGGGGADGGDESGGSGGGGGSVSMKVPGMSGTPAGGAAGSGSSTGAAAAGQSTLAAGGEAMPGLKQSGGAGGGQQAPSGASSASAAVSVAQARGKNWASLATQDRPIPLTRPIRIECALDEFRVLDDSGKRVQSRIPLDGETAAAIDPLVKAVHARVADWGLAGERMYWKPQLVLSATPDGRSRRDDLERLLTDSGLDTRHSGQQDEIRNLPPVQRTSYLHETR